MRSKLSPSFYRQATEKVAQKLLGKILVHQIGKKRVSGIIVETEAYLGLDDPACHSFGGKKTPRVQAMYLSGGHSYVYLIYGMHYCFNVVTRNAKFPEAVLIRALEPLDGQEVMLKNRATPLAQSTNGPGKLCQALGINRSHDSLPLWSHPLFIEKNPNRIKTKVVSAPRIGIDYAGKAKNWPLRFYLAGNRFVSKR